MTIKEAEQFYKNDKKKYLVNENLEFLNWFHENLQKGYSSYLNLEDIQKLIWKLLRWYEFKYPERMFCEDEGIISTRFNNLQSITNLMDLNELNYRLTNNELNVLECNYRGNSGYCIPKEDDFGNFTYINYINFDIIDKKENKERNYTFSIDASTGKIRKCDLEYFNNGYASNVSKIEDMYYILKNNNNYDITSLEQVIFFHNIDLILRYQILSLVKEALIYSLDTTPENGYKRAQKFVQEFNEYYNIDLCLENFDKFINGKTMLSAGKNLKKSYIKRKIKRM